MQTDCSKGHNDGKQRQKRPEFVRRIHELRRKGQAFRQDGVKPVRRIHNLRHQGRKIGRSEPNLFGGGYTHYDANGKKIGSGEPDFFGGYTNYDANGHKVGSSEPGLFGGYTSYDANRHKTGSSAPGLFSTPSYGSSKYTASDSGTCSGEGCYIATCVYGSYGAPEVLTLRRFRDEILKKAYVGPHVHSLLLRNKPVSGKMVREKRMVPPLLEQTAGRDGYASEFPQKPSVRGINLQIRVEP